MGLLAELRDSYQIKLNQDRINSGLPPLKFDREETAWEKEQRIKLQLPVQLKPDTEVKILFQLNEEARKKVDRYREVFRNSPKMLEMYVDKLISASNPEELKEANEFVKDRKNVNLYADKKDFTKWSDLSFYGDQRWDMIYRPESKSPR